MKPFTLPFLLILSAVHAALLHPRADTGSKSLAKCFYDYPCPLQCTSSPDASSCQQSINAVCAKVATGVPDGKDQWFLYSTSNATYNPTSLEGPMNHVPDPKTDCLAIVRTPAKLTLFPSQESCVRTFQAIQGCGATTNQGFNASCVGGSINTRYCDDKHGLLVDDTVPGFLLESAEELHVAPESTHVLVAAGGEVGEASQQNIDETTTLGPLKLEEYERSIAPVEP